MVAGCINFCVDELLWMLTWGWYQLAFGILLSWLSYVCIGRLKMVPALALAVGSYGFAMFIYFSFVAGLFVYYLQSPIATGMRPSVYSPFWASLVLGFIYSVLQLLFFALINYWRRLSVKLFFIIAVVCNSSAALLASCFIKVVF